MSLNLVDYNGLVKFKEELEQSIGSQQGGNVSDERLIDNASINILENKLESGSTGSGAATMTYTVNEDGTVTIVSNTTASTQYLTLNSEVILYAGNYTLYGCTAGGGDSSYWLEITPSGGTTYKDYGHGVNFTIASDTTAQVKIAIADSCKNLTFKPSLERGTKALLVFTDPSNSIEFGDNIVIIDEVEIDGDIYLYLYDNSTGEYLPPVIKPKGNGLENRTAQNDYDTYYPTNVELAAMIDNASNVDVATTSVAGIVKPDGTSITIDLDGTIHGADTVPIATTSVAGKVKPDGTTITIDSNGVISGASSVSIATSSTVGIVKPDNTTIEVDSNGIISGKKATSSTLGVVKPDGTTTSVDSNGAISIYTTNYTTSELDTLWESAVAEASNSTPIDD